MAAVLLIVLVIPFATGCGAHAREARAEHAREYQALSRLEPRQVLAGRNPEAVLMETLPRAGCTWLEKGLLFPGENRTVATGHAYDPDLRQLTLHQYSEFNWSPWSVHRTTSDVIVSLADLESKISPPDPLGSFQCWSVDLACPDGECILVHKHSQLRQGDRTTEDRGEKNETIRYWHVSFARRQAAIDAWAALRVLAE